MKRRYLYAVTVFFVLQGTAQVFAAPVVCYGDRGASKQFIYLHGMDSSVPSAQELENRALMLKLAKQLKARVAIPRGNHLCQGKVCWKQGTIQEVDNTFRQVLEESRDCLDLTRPYGLLGFSNGGYLASKVAHFCVPPQPSWIIASGSAGQPPMNKELSKCPRMALLIGTKDITRKKTESYFQQLKSRRAMVSFRTFPSGHVLLEKPLLETILQLSR